jgi:hypothetical protein
MNSTGSHAIAEKIDETGDFNILCCLHIFVHMFGKYSEIFLKVALSTIKSTKYPLLFIMNTKTLYSFQNQYQFLFN